MPDEADIREARRRIESAYDPNLLRCAGHRLVDLLADHMSRIQSAEGSVLSWSDPRQCIQLASAELDRAIGSGAGRDALADHFAQLVRTMLGHSQNIQHPRYIGHQVAASVPLAGLFDAVGAVTNQAMAIYEMGPWATAAEWALVDRLGQAIGWKTGEFSGLITHGGSLANLTALLTARNVAMGDSWERGTARAGVAPVLLAHSDAHYSVARSAGILGIGTSNVLRVGLDQRRRMDPGKLAETLSALRNQNRQVIAVVACACSTPIGAFDPLDDLTDVCQRFGVWMHVDAAHGGAACLSARYRHLLAGVDRADSIVCDAHKMLFVPALCGFVFYRKAAHKFEAFRQDAPYLFDPTAPGLAEYDSGLRTVECTKRAAAFGLWGLWSLFGQRLFADLMDVTFSMGRALFEKLSAAADFRPLHEPQCNIVAFRHVPHALRDAPSEVVGRFQLDLRRRIIESGRFYIVSTKLDGVGAIRVTIINPLTTPDHLDELLQTIRDTGRQLLAERNYV